MDKEKLIRDLNLEIESLRYEQSQTTTKRMYDQFEHGINQLNNIISCIISGKYDNYIDNYISRFEKYDKNLRELYCENRRIYRENLLYKVTIYILITLSITSHLMR